MCRDPDVRISAAGRLRHLGALAIAAVAAAPVVPGSALVGQQTADEIRSVRFEGNETFPPDSLERAIVTRATECRSLVLQPFCWVGMGFALRRTSLRERELPRDRARLTIWYQRRGFLDVQVDSARVTRLSGQVDVLFRLTEGEPVRASAVDFEGPDDALTDEVVSNLPLRQGDRLSTLSRDATRDTLIQRLRNQGYAHADVFFRALRPNDDPYNARVTFEVVPGPVATYGDIDVQGLAELSPGTIRRTLQFETGDRYRASDIEDARARLFGLDIVRSARVEPDLSVQPDSVVPVSVLVQEGDAYRVRTGGGWSTAECLALEARWTSRNFLGGGRIFQVRGRLGNVLASEFADPLCTGAGSGRYARLTWVAAVDFAQPWIFSTDNSLTGSVFFERQTLPDIFVRRAVGFQVGLTRTIDRGTTLTGLYRPELSELDADDVLFCTGFLVCTPEDVEALEGANWLAPVGLTFNRDRSDDLLNPRRGYRSSLELEHAADWTGSSYRYDRAVAEFSHYRELGGPVLATRIRGGWVGSGAFDLGSRGGEVSIIHPQRRFFAGGANSVRGFGQSRLGPSVLFVRSPEELLSAAGAACAPEELIDRSCDVGARRDSVDLQDRPTGGTRVLEGNAEIRLPLVSWLELVAFTDFGQAWGGDVESVTLGDVEFTPGFGVRFPSPVGPIRVDLAFRTGGSESLPVIVPQIRSFQPGVDDPSALLVVDGSDIPFVRADQLTTLMNTVSFDGNARGFQLHISIGQAF